MRYPKSLIAVHFAFLVRQKEEKLIIDQTDPDVFKMVLNFYVEGLWPCYYLDNKTKGYARSFDSDHFTKGVVIYGYDPEVNTRQDFEDMLAYYNLPEFSNIQQVYDTIAKRTPEMPKLIPSINDFDPLRPIEPCNTDNIPENIVFYVKHNGIIQYIPLLREDLIAYPDSLLTIIAATFFCLDEIELHGFTADTLVEIWNFYKKGLWCFNPYNASEKHKFTMIDPNGIVMDSFNNMCKYLNLPDNFDDAYISDDEELSEETLAIMEYVSSYSSSSSDEGYGYW